MSTVNVIRIIAGLAFAGTFLVIAVFYLGLLARILKKCSPQARTMEPGLVWLLLIPLVSSIWIFFVVIALAKSLGNEFRLRNIPADSEPGIDWDWHGCVRSVLRHTGREPSHCPRCFRFMDRLLGEDGWIFEDAGCGSGEPICCDADSRSLTSEQIPAEKAHRWICARSCARA